MAGSHSSGRASGGAAVRAAVLIVLLLALGLIVRRARAVNLAPPEESASAAVEAAPGPAAESGAGASTSTPPPAPTPDPLESYVLAPRAVASTEPSIYVESTDIMAAGELVPSYSRAEPVFFGPPAAYPGLPGVMTFRGNNFRTGGSYGLTAATGQGLSAQWLVSTGSLQAPDGTVWTGSGWVGQPLIVKWPQSTKRIMNMYDWAREDESLVEVIYATMDGNVYFLELTTGRYTRDRLNLGFTFKGAGALDPRGYPVLYVGAGYDSYQGDARAMAVSLINGSVLFSFGAEGDFAYRGWTAFDGAPLVDSETDTLVWAGESGVLYLVRLNTAYDEAAGTLSMAPDIVQWRYKTLRSGDAFWMGMEDSVAAWQGYGYVADNGGHMMCIDLNTLSLVWVQDVQDDTNCSPVLSVEDGRPYIYISTSFHAGWRAGEYDSAVCPIWKLDALTGEIIWRNDSYACRTESGVSGGVQGTIALGEHSLAGLVFVPVSRTPGGYEGVLAALNAQTGEAVWEFKSAYSWSSPVITYDAQGRGYIVYTTTGGDMYLVDGLTGTELGWVDLGDNTEASPAVYGDFAVVGTRGDKIFGVKLT